MTELTIDEALQQGIEAHKAGQVQEADRLYTAILKTQPKHPDANHNMGVLAVSVGKVEQALPFFKTALEANPATAQFWLSYIDALMKLERLADAKAVMDQARSKGAKGDGFDKLEQRLKDTGQEPLEATQIASEAQPNILDSLKLDQAISLAKKKEKAGSPEESRRIYEDILVKFPKNKRAIDGLKLLAGKSVGKASKTEDAPKEELQSLMTLYNNGQRALVVEQAQTLTKQYPRAFAVWNLMGASAAQIGQLDQAIFAFKRVLTIKPDYAGAYNNLGNALRAQGELEEALETYNKALAIAPDYAEAYSNMGVTLQELGKLEEAIEAYNKALAINPDYAETYNNMGVTLQEQGKLEEAIEAYTKALTIKPDYAEVHRHLSILTKYTTDTAQISEVEALLQQADINDSTRCNLLYTHAKMQEDLGNLSAAFDSYVTGGDLRQKLLAYEFSQDEQLFGRIRQTAPQFKDVVLDVTGEPVRHTPIFILGMPRSGTTLVEQIISSHSEVIGAGELKYVSLFGANLVKGISDPTLEAVSLFREQYLAQLSKSADGQAFITDKMPENFRYIALICAALPESKIVHVRRSAEATCWSNFKHYFGTKGLGYSYNLRDTIAYYELYRDLMHFWSQSYSDRIYHLDYDKLTEDQEPETRRLIERLGLNWEYQCLAPQDNKRSVKTASQQQVRQKVYRGSSQVWRKYEPFLDGAFNGLESQSEPRLDSDL